MEKKGQCASHQAEAGKPQGSNSGPYELGRRLILTFHGEANPSMHKVEFCHSSASRWVTFEDGVTAYYKFDGVPQAFALLILDYVHHALSKNRREFMFRGARKGSLAASLSNAIGKGGFIDKIFNELSPPAAPTNRLSQAVRVSNQNGSDKDSDRSLSIQPEYLPPECIEIFWEAKDKDPLVNAADVLQLGNQIRRCIGEAIKEPPEREAAPAPRTTPAKIEPAAPPIAGAASVKVDDLHPEKAGYSFGVSFARGIVKSMRAAVGAVKPVLPPTLKQPLVQKQHPSETQLPFEDTRKPPKPDVAGENAGKPESQQTIAEEIPEEIGQAKINPELFKVRESGAQWPEDMPLIRFRDHEEQHVWTLKNAFEGVLISGATGSGKTSGSGATIAQTFLHHGFGGLVLTAKENEAERWRRLCAHCGREGDLVNITLGGNWKLNVLAYMAEAPGRGSGLTSNLVSFFKNLQAVSTRQQGQMFNEQFWENSTALLLNALFDLFLLSKSELSFGNLSKFISFAPLKRVPKTEDAWSQIPTFGTVLVRAKKNAQGGEDKEIFEKAVDYWCNIYPGLDDKPRSAITLGVHAMLDTFRGRGVPPCFHQKPQLPRNRLSPKER